MTGLSGGQLTELVARAHDARGARNVRTHPSEVVGAGTVLVDDTIWPHLVS
ncbi:MAG: hypothetical protein ACRDST_04440 [Pseudonocardiaceae bacterium]